MKNRAFTSPGLRLGSVLLGFGVLLVSAAIPLRSAGSEPAAECTSCHDQGSKLAKSAHSSLSCDTCHESHDKVPHPANIPKPSCVTCHADQAGDYDQGVHGQARKGGNEGAPDCALCHGSAHELLAP
ncbi:MAG: cytochrome b subunit of formate dehydrogenase-like protein, partial [Candidatus Solibacter sp.]|nr:cytochrome b subunit of formate dehydrogenase-like protein [Candidatus Solibacter sp.]